MPLPSPISSLSATSSTAALGNVPPVPPAPVSSAVPPKITEVPSTSQPPPPQPVSFLVTISHATPAAPTSSVAVSPSKATDVILPLQAVASSSLSVHSDTKTSSSQALGVSDTKVANDEEWIKCVGQLGVITDHCRDLVKNLKRDNVIVNIEEFLTSVASSTEEIKLLCEKLELKSHNLLSQVLEEGVNKEDYLTDALKSEHQVPHDPGSRPVVLTDRQRMYLVNLGPYQPKLSSFPKNEVMKKVNDTCCFSSRWYDEYPYLEYSIATDRAYCFVCTLFSHGFDREKSERVWIEGFYDWRKAKGSRGKGKPGKIQSHFQSNSHKAALFDYAKFCTESEHVDLLLDKSKRTKLIEEEKILQQHRKVIAMIIDACRTLARQGLAFRNEPEKDSNFEQIIQLLSRHNTVL